VRETELDEQKLRTLSTWAVGLRNDGRAEVAAAGRAIEMLIDEVERLHVLLWDRRLYPAEPDGVEAADAAVPGEAVEGELDQTLRGRLKGRWRRASPEPS
jgi:hypothetical protein